MFSFSLKEQWSMQSSKQLGNCFSSLRKEEQTKKQCEASSERFNTAVRPRGYGLDRSAVVRVEERCQVGFRKNILTGFARQINRH